MVCFPKEKNIYFYKFTFTLMNINEDDTTYHCIAFVHIQRKKKKNLWSGKWRLKHGFSPNTLVIINSRKTDLVIKLPFFSLLRGHLYPGKNILDSLFQDYVYNKILVLICSLYISFCARHCTCVI